MRKLLQAVVLSLAVVGLVGGVASADSVTCWSGISDTGPDSDNVVTCVNDQNNTLKCENNVVVVNEDYQDALSGNTFVVTNTSGGDAVSGGSDNRNVTIVQVGASCSPVGEAPSTPVPTTPGTSAPTAAAPATSKPAVLGAQVSRKPVGGVGAGGGAGAQSNAAVAISGLVASLGAVVAGVIVRKRAVNL